MAPFGFTGEVQHGSNVYLRARWYNASRGVFTAKDPFAGFNEQPYSLHPYQYAYSQPTTLTDPSGRSPEFCSLYPAECMGGGTAIVKALELICSTPYSCAIAVLIALPAAAINGAVAICRNNTCETEFYTGDLGIDMRNPYDTPIHTGQSVPTQSLPRTIGGPTAKTPSIADGAQPGMTEYAGEVCTDTGHAWSGEPFNPFVSITPKPEMPDDIPANLRKAVMSYYNREVFKRPGSKRRVASVAVNRDTGEVVWENISSAPSKEVEAKLRELYGTNPPMGYDWSQRAEGGGCDKAMLDGISLINLDIFTWEITSGKPVERCDNCKITVNQADQRIYSEPPYPSHTMKQIKGAQ